MGLLCLILVMFLLACGNTGQSVVQSTPALESVPTPPAEVAPLHEPMQKPTPTPTIAATPTATPTLAPGPLTASEIFEKVSPSIAFITNNAWTGSGVLLEDGHVVTNAHVVWPFDSARVVFPDGSEFHEVPVRGWDLLADLAVLGPINRPTDGLALSDGEGLPIGANLFLIGYPAETEKFPQPTIVRGLLSRVREWESIGITYLQVDATIIGGQNGGALVSEAGHVIGISGLRFTEANFAMVASASDFIPRAKELIDGRNPSELGDRGALLQGGELRHGITLENYWSQRAYLINEPPGALIDFELTGDNDGGFTIYDPYGFELLSADNGSTGAEDGAYTIERDEPHFLVAWQWPETIGDFTLKSSHRLTQIHDPDDGRQLQVSQPARGNIDFPTDLDYFLVDLTEGEVIEVIAESSVADTFLTIDYVGALDTQIIVDDDSGAGLLGLDSAIIYRAPHTGRYFVVVSDANYSAPGGYVITVKRAARNAVPTTTTWASLFGESVATEPPSAQSAFGLAELRSAFTGSRQVVGGDTLIIRLTSTSVLRRYGTWAATTSTTS